MRSLFDNNGHNDPADTLDEYLTPWECDEIMLLDIMSGLLFPPTEREAGDSPPGAVPPGREPASRGEGLREGWA